MIQANYYYFSYKTLSLIMEPRLRYQVIYVSVKNKFWTYDSPLADSIIVQKYHLLINVFLQHCYHSGI